MTLGQALNILRDYQADPRIQAIYENLLTLHNMAKSSQDISNIRAELLLILSNRNSEDLHDVVHQTLLILAEYAPIEDVDPISLEDIPEEERVVISTGEQFNLNLLLEYHKYRTSGYTFHQSMRNPNTNLDFNPQDEAHILRMAQNRGLEIPQNVNLNLDEEFLEWLSQQMQTHGIFPPR